MLGINISRKYLNSFSQFKRMLNRELNHFSESGKSGSQVSDYIFSTFMGERIDRNY